MKIVLLSKSKLEEDEIDIVTKLFENGLGTYHIRKPRVSTKQMKELLDSIPIQFHNRIVIHSHHNLARKYNLKGVHYTKSHLKKSFKNWWRKVTLGIAKSDLIKTTSHSKLISLYDKHEINYDYVFLSPIFDSLSGKFQSGFHMDGIVAAIQKSGVKIIARGGVEEKRIEQIRDLGFYGMALNTCIWNSKDPIDSFHKILAKCKELNISVE